MRKLFFILFMLTLSGVMAQEKVKFLLFADLHYDIMPDAAERLHTILKQARKQKVDFILELGDFIPATPENREWKKEFDVCGVPVYHTLGNHDVDRVNKQAYMDYWGMPSSYYYFDRGCFRFIVLDSDFFMDKDGQVKPYDKGNYGRVSETDRNKYSEEEIAWLKYLLQDKTRIHVLFSHAPVNDGYSEVILNKEIHDVIVNARNLGTKIAMVFGGHMHSDNYHLVDGIHYMQVNSASNIWGGTKFTNTERYSEAVYKEFPSLKYVISYEDPLYAIVEISSKGMIKVEGKKSRYVRPEPDKELLKTKPYPCSSVISTLTLKF
ncbi:metallophosphoesterase family protein [Bacteroides sp.]